MMAKIIRFAPLLGSSQHVILSIADGLLVEPNRSIVTNGGVLLVYIDDAVNRLFPADFSCSECCRKTIIREGRGLLPSGSNRDPGAPGAV